MPIASIYFMVTITMSPAGRRLHRHSRHYFLGHIFAKTPNTRQIFFPPFSPGDGVRDGRPSVGRRRRRQAENLFLGSRT